MKVARGAHFRKLQVVATALCCRVAGKEDAPTTDWKKMACAQPSSEGDRRSAKWSDYNVSVLNALFSTAHSCRGLFLQLSEMRPPGYIPPDVACRMRRGGLGIFLHL